MDAFITLAPYYKIVIKLSGYSSPYKIKILGEILAWKYV